MRLRIQLPLRLTQKSLWLQTNKGGYVKRNRHRFSALAIIIFVRQPLIGLAFGGTSAPSVRQEMSYSAGEALLVTNSMGVFVNL